MPDKPCRRLRSVPCVCVCVCVCVCARARVSRSEPREPPRRDSEARTVPPRLFRTQTAIEPARKPAREPAREPDRYR